ncbi:MAG: sulfate adenylyltransferase subunit 1 [Terriglobales bacterium]
MSAAFETLARRAGDAELLRFTTAGDVDSGKSTLLGRLLHDCQAVYEDQVAAVRNGAINRSHGEMDFALLLDGLRAEREQGITIDVAYRYFSSPKRRFLIADTPGHEQYTRNMATGASHADAAVVVIDAGEGLRPQSRRHILLAHLLGLREIVAVINKMDRLGFSREGFAALRDEAADFARRLGVASFHALPASAVEGDNVAHRGARMPWYSGPTLLELLETLPIVGRAATRPLRLPVQLVIRPDGEFRGLAGPIASGRLRAGQYVAILPGGQTARIERIVAYEGDLAEAAAPAAVTVTLDRDLDVGRGAILADPEAPPIVARRFLARVAWFGEQPLRAGDWLLLKLSTQLVRARAARIRHRLRLDDLAHEPVAALAANEIGEVEWQAAAPLAFDPYQDNPATGALLLIDPQSNATAGLGMIAAALDRRESGGERPRHPVQAWLAASENEAAEIERQLAAAGVATRRIAAGTVVLVRDEPETEQI